VTGATWNRNRESSNTAGIPALHSLFVFPARPPGFYGWASIGLNLCAVTVK